MQRREFISLLGGAAAAWPLVARAQRQPALPVIGYLGAGAPETSPRLMAAFRAGLSANGYVEGLNVEIEYRWANGVYDRLPALAAELVRRGVAVIATPGATPAAMAAMAVTSTIPIVFQIGADPVEIGLVASLNRPGGNLTGVTSLNVEVGAKRPEVLRELLPTASTAALLVNPTNPALADPETRAAQAAARTLKLQLHVVEASTEREFDTVFTSLARLQIGALVIGTDLFNSSKSGRLATLALRHRVPAVYQYREFVTAGGLMSYGGSSSELYRLTGLYTGRILKGERPAEIPVQQATRVELIINMKTAKALDLTFPITLLGRADEVIE